MKILNVLAVAAVVLGVIGAACPAHAQIGGLSEVSGGTRTAAVGKPERFRDLTVLFSPYTSFQRTFPSSGGGKIYQNKQTNAGPLVLFEKLYRLDQRETFLAKHPHQGSTFTLGGYYWYNSASRDRLTVYGKYFPNSTVGIGLNLGGETHSTNPAQGGNPGGVTEYYGFVLINALRVTSKNNLAIQLGLGPYIPRSSIGNIGYTGSAAAAYRLGAYSTLVASLWYVDFKTKNQASGFSRNETTARVSVGVAYNF